MALITPNNSEDCLSIGWEISFKSPSTIEIDPVPVSPTVNLLQASVIAVSGKLSLSNATISSPSKIISPSLKVNVIESP